MNPLTGIYGAATALRNTLYDRGALSSRRLQQPVVSVGNLSAGGSGKTRSSSRSANSCKHVAFASTCSAADTAAKLAESS